MCGITGAIFKDIYQQDVNGSLEKYFELLKASEIRGQDGTGIAYVKTAGPLPISEIFTERSNQKASKWLGDRDYTIKGGHRPVRAIIGQNRLAIFGQGHKNDQPIVTEQSALVHNGNLYDFEPMFREYSLKRELQVDSELIIRLIEHLNGDISGHRVSGLRSAVSFATDVLKGNYACLLLDKQTASITAFAYFKPLFKYEDKTGVYFFSTERIGQKVFGNVPFEQIENKEILQVL